VFQLFAFVMLNLAVMLGGVVLYLKNVPTEHERQTRNIADPTLAPALAQMRMWRATLQFLGGALAVIGALGNFYALFLFVRMM
jgi:hypothetical protein